MTTASYPLVKYPDSKAMSLEGGEVFFSKFLRAIPDRISILEREVRARESSTWKADYDPASLDVLTLLLKHMCHTRPMTDKEFRKAARGADSKMRALIRKDKVLTQESASVASDVGLYVAECLLRRYHNLYWSRITKPRNHLNYNRPVLLGFPFKYPLDFEPVGAGEVQGLLAVEPEGDRECNVRAMFEGLSRWARGIIEASPAESAGTDRKDRRRDERQHRR